MKTCRKGLHQYEGKQCSECNAARRSTPEYKAWKAAWERARGKARRATPEYKAQDAARRATPEYKAWRAETASMRRARRRGTPIVIRNDPRILGLRQVVRFLCKHGDAVHVDHIVPLQRKGPHCFENLRILPASENCKKGAKMPRLLEFAHLLYYFPNWQDLLAAENRKKFFVRT